MTVSSIFFRKFIPYSFFYFLSILLYTDKIPYDDYLDLYGF